LVDDTGEPVKHKPRCHLKPIRAHVITTKLFQVPFAVGDICNKHILCGYKKIRLHLPVAWNSNVEKF